MLTMMTRIMVMVMLSRVVMMVISDDDGDDNDVSQCASASPDTADFLACQSTVCANKMVIFSSNIASWLYVC